MRQPIDLVGGFYTDDSLPWSCQDTVNYLPVAAEAGGTRTPTKLVDAPGLRPWVAIGNTDGDPTAGSPIRGLHDVEGRLFVVSGTMLYEIGQTGVAIPRGAIPGVGRVSMAHNQRSHGHELLVVNGSGGYVYNTATDTFTVVTDPGYPGAGIADFLDGYLMQVEPFGRFLFHSDLADALEYNTLDRFEAETQPDRVVGMIVNHQEVWAFGDRTIDVFGNVGTAQGTFQNKGVSISRGCIAKWSPAIIDNGVAWLGDDRVVYHARGYDPVRISTRAIEVALSQCSLADIRNAFSFIWSDRGHSVYYLTVPNGLTFGYDFSTGLWHRRATWHPERDIGGRWRLSDLVRSNGRWIGGDYLDGNLYVLDWDYMLEGCDPLVRERVSPVSHNNGARFTVDSVETIVETGGKETQCGEPPPEPDEFVPLLEYAVGFEFMPDLSSQWGLAENFINEDSVVVLIRTEEAINTGPSWFLTFSEPVRVRITEQHFDADDGEHIHFNQYPPNEADDPTSSFRPSPMVIELQDGETHLALNGVQGFTRHESSFLIEVGKP